MNLLSGNVDILIFSTEHFSELQVFLTISLEAIVDSFQKPQGRSAFPISEWKKSVSRRYRNA